MTLCTIEMRTIADDLCTRHANLRCARKLAELDRCQAQEAFHARPHASGLIVFLFHLPTLTDEISVI